MKEVLRVGHDKCLEVFKLSYTRTRMKSFCATLELIILRGGERSSRKIKEVEKNSTHLGHDGSRRAAAMAGLQTRHTWLIKYEVEIFYRERLKNKE